MSASLDSTGRQPDLALPRRCRIRRPEERVKVERPQAEPVVERPLHVTEDGHHRGSEEEPAHDKRSRISPPEHIPLITNWICD